MRGATRELTGKGLPYAGPSYRVLESCYDKLFAYRTIGAAGIDYPPTSWDAQSLSFQKPFLVKPRRGSDSLGVRILPNHIPAKYRTEHFLIQQFVDGKEITVGYLDGLVGHPFEILRPPGTIYSFARKNIFRTRKRPLEDAGSVNKIGEVVKKVCSLMGIDWAARVDFLYETREERLYFLECDAAPLIHKTSAFAMTLELAGMNRPLQIEALLRTEQRV
jgi:D-alanine-D-alanine ligase